MITWVDLKTYLSHLEPLLLRYAFSLFTSSGSIDLRTLCIAPGRHCWAVYVDVLVLESGGSLLDTMALAVYAALLDTRLPRIHLVAGEAPGDVGVEVDEDPAASSAFPGAAGIPVCVTFLQVPSLGVAVDACPPNMRPIHNLNKRLLFVS